MISHHLFMCAVAVIYTKDKIRCFKYGERKMKYFELMDTPELRYVPKLKNWQEKPEETELSRKLFLIEASDQILFTDIIAVPVLLMSPAARKIMEKYKRDCVYKEVILLDEVSGQSKLYYQPELYETDQLLVIGRMSELGAGWKKYTGEYRKWKPVIRDPAFVVRDRVGKHIILSLELAEELLYCGMSGVGLREVDLLYQEKDGKIRNE